MKIFSGGQIREWDAYTILHEPVSSIDLMERAAGKCVDWLIEHHLQDNKFSIFCGKGNNGGDGLAIARMLSEKDARVLVYILEFGHLGTEDFQVNLERLHEHGDVEIRFIQSQQQFPALNPQETVIDAIFGSGLNRPLEGVTARLVEHINVSGCAVISIDIPSGLPVDHSAKGSVIKAHHTLSFQVVKQAFLMQDNAPFAGEVHVLDIGLHPGFYRLAETKQELIDEEIISSIYRPREPFAHKGNFGHSLVVSGSYGKLGAALLCSKACVRAGAGLTTAHVPGCGYESMQSSVPEVMVMTDFNSSIITRIEEDISRFSCIGIGPGIGTATETRQMLSEVFERYRKPLVMDADALNIISSDRELFKKIPSKSILTPHPKEFERLFGKAESDFERLDLARQNAKEMDLVIVLKGHHTSISTPGGRVYFNSTGNPGMAKGGSGDVLTGVITALVSQKYDTIEAAILGVYLHGLAGDIAATKYSPEAMTAGDIVDNLGQAFLAISTGSRRSLDKK